MFADRRGVGPVSMTMGRLYTVESVHPCAGNPTQSVIVLLSPDDLDRWTPVVETWQAELMYPGQMFRVGMVEVL